MTMGDDILQQKLKPCPFCGGKAEPRLGMHVFDDVMIICDGCGTEGPLFDSEDGDDPRRINSIAAILHWNTRANGQGVDTK